MKRKLINRLIDKKDIHEEIRLINGTDSEYISPNGNIYTDYGNDMFLPKKNFINKNNGYIYINIKSKSGKQIQRRVHRLIAETYIPNPNNLPIVMHKDNNKENIAISNLKWGTVSENTKQAHDDGLIKNDRGFNDSQSFPVVLFDENQNYICQFGSVRIASENTGISPSGILYQCKHKVRSKPRCGFYFRFLDEYDKFGFVL